MNDLRREFLTKMRTRLIRTFSTLVSLLLVVAVPAQASPIKFVDVVNVIGDVSHGGQLQQLRLRAAMQDPTTRPQEPSTTASTTAPAVTTDPLASSAAGTTQVAPNLVAGMEVAGQQPQSNVEVFEQDSVDGTICDCGEIPAVGGGIPWWPFLALIPLVCVTGVCSHNPPPTVSPSQIPQITQFSFPGGSTPSPQITQFSFPPSNVPEPTSLLLLGSGIVAITAGARRRYMKMRANKGNSDATEAL